MLVLPTSRQAASCCGVYKRPSVRAASIRASTSLPACAAFNWATWALTSFSASIVTYLVGSGVPGLAAFRLATSVVSSPAVSALVFNAASAVTRSDSAVVAGKPSTLVTDSGIAAFNAATAPRACASVVASVAGKPSDASSAFSNGFISVGSGLVVENRAVRAASWTASMPSSPGSLVRAAQSSFCTAPVFLSNRKTALMYLYSSPLI